MDFANKIVLVTGAAGGIGKASAQRFYAQGASLVLVDLQQQALDALVTEAGFAPERVLVIASDISKEAKVESFVSAAIERFGHIDVFFNNAGIEGRVGPLVDTDAATLDALVDVNFKGSFFGLKHVLKAMMARKAGAIVNTSSMAGLIGFASLGVYTATKHAVIGLTRVAAQESVAAGVRVNAVCPGPVNTRMMRGIETGISADHPEQVHAQFAALTGMNRYAEPDEIASVVLFLASEKASYITGSIYTADGGMTGM